MTPAQSRAAWMLIEGAQGCLADVPGYSRAAWQSAGPEAPQMAMWLVAQLATELARATGVSPGLILTMVQAQYSAEGEAG